MIGRLKPRSMNGIFAVNKPSGVSSSQFLGELQAIFTKSEVFQKDLNEARSKTTMDLSKDKKWSKERIKKKVKNLKVKIGHGGTLDPLASGVLIVGIGTGTKKLQYYLSECAKTYDTEGLLGISTTTGDAEGEIVSQNGISHITKEMITQAASKFVGDIKQTPPIFSALKVNGKALYDYARENIPLPVPIKERNVKVFNLEVHEKDSLAIDHPYQKLQSELDADGNAVEQKLSNNPTLNDSPLYFSEQYFEKAEAQNKPKLVGKPRRLSSDELLPEKLPLLHFTAEVSSGTYIRSLLSDIGRALESSAYMVSLKRVKQSDWEVGKNVFEYSDFTEKNEDIWGPVLRKCLEVGPSYNVVEEINLLASKAVAVPKNDFSQPNENEHKEDNTDLPSKEKQLAQSEQLKPSLELNHRDLEVPKKRSASEVEKDAKH